MNDSTGSNTDTRPEWFADFEEKLVDLIRSAPGSQTQDLGACLTVLIPRGGSADSAVFGGLVTSREEHPDTMRMELLTAVVWALIADGVPPDALRAAFDHSLGILDDTSSYEAAPPLLDEEESGVIN